MRLQRRGASDTPHFEATKCQTIEHYLVIGYGLRQNPPVGEMAERLNALVLKTSKV